VRRVPVAPVCRGYEVADVHLAVAEPVVIGIVVVVDPPNYLLIDDDAGCGLGLSEPAQSHRWNASSRAAINTAVSSARGARSLTEPFLPDCSETTNRFCPVRSRSAQRMTPENFVRRQRQE